MAFRLLPSRTLSSLFVVIAPRKPSPFSVRPRMFRRDLAIAERSVRRSPLPSRSFSRPAPWAGGISPPIGTSGSSALPPSSSMYLSPSRPRVLIDARVLLRIIGVQRRTTSYTTRTVRSAGSPDSRTSMTLPTTTPFKETLLPVIRPAADSKWVSKGNLLRKRFARWPIMKTPIIVTARATMTTIPTRKRRPTCCSPTTQTPFGAAG